MAAMSSNRSTIFHIIDRNMTMDQSPAKTHCLLHPVALQHPNAQSLVSPYLTPSIMQSHAQKQTV
jgi:hypothetical protein